MAVTAAGRRPGVARTRALTLGVPALGLSLAVVLLATSGHLVGPSGWYARILAAVFGTIALIGLIFELVGQRTAAAAASAEPVDDVAVTGVPDEEAPLAIEHDGPHPAPSGRGLVRVGMLVVSVIAMIVVTDLLGFWLAMAVPVVATLLLLGVRTWWKVLLATVLTIAGGYVVFTLLLRVRVPEGILGLI